MYQRLISLYPLFWPRFYVWLRLKILPLSQIEEYIPQKSSVLDVGCGYGFSTIYFALRSSARQVKGIELDLGRIQIAEIASRDIKNVSFQSDNLANQQRQHYQTIVMIDLLHHLSTMEKSKLLQQSFQLLPSNGLLLIKDIDTKPLPKYLWNYLHDLVMTKFDRLDFYGSDKMTDFIKSFGFKVTKQLPIRNYFYPHYLYVCKKS